MDKKNTLIGISLILIAFGLFFMESKRAADIARERAEQAERAPTAAPAPAATAVPSSVLADDEDDLDLGRPATLPVVEEDPGLADVLPLTPATDAPVATLTEARPDETLVTLRNSFMEVDFTDRGGAIREVRFLQTLRGGPDTYIFNEGMDLPALNLSFATGGSGLREYRRRFEIIERSNTRIVFQFRESGGLTVRRTFSLSDNGRRHEAYSIRHDLEFLNSAETPLALPEIFLSLGVAMPVESDRRGEFLNLGYYDGNKSRFIGGNVFRGSGGFLGMGAKPPRPLYEAAVNPLVWASVKNQFFVSILTPDFPGRSIRGNMITLPATEPGQLPQQAVTGNAGFQVEIIPSGGSRTLGSSFYVGPKEFLRLQTMTQNQDLNMQFGFFGFFSKILLSFMHLIHSVIPSWGWSIVIMTICIKLLFWPLTAKAARSQKRMSKIAEPMKALQEKYKDNPQKKQQEMIKLFKENKINPAAGCLPILIQIPIFIGLFWMLRSASELRMAPFLWVSDLSQPDTLFEVGGFPINLLPLIMAITMFIQMRIVPMSPTMDPMQKKIFQFLPFIFLIFLYGFSSGLVLYWTVQNLLTILQTWLIHRRKDDPELAVVVPPTDGKGARKGKPPVPGRKPTQGGKSGQGGKPGSSSKK
jgi:YidC/Oxa1 family membrane protein insertase